MIIDTSRLREGNGGGCWVHGPCVTGGQRPRVTGQLRFILVHIDHSCEIINDA